MIYKQVHSVKRKDYNFSIYRDKSPIIYVREDLSDFNLCKDQFF